MKYENTKDALAAIYKQFGADILLGKLNAYFSDFAPSVPANYKKLVYAVYTFGASDVLKNNLNESHENKEAAVKVAVRCLTDAFISKKIAEDIIFEFVDALGWKVDREVLNPQPAPVPTPVVQPAKQSQPTPAKQSQPAPQTPSLQPVSKPVVQPQPVKQPPVKKPPPAQKPKPVKIFKPRPAPKPRKKIRLPYLQNKVIFAVVDRDSGLGSSIIFGILFASIGITVGSMVGGFIANIAGGVIGWGIGNKLIGKSIYVNLIEIILGTACGILIAFLAGWIANGLRPDLAPVIARIVFVPFMIAGTALFLIGRSKGNLILLITLIIFAIGGGIALTEPPFPFDFSPKLSVQTQGSAIPLNETAGIINTSVNFRSGPSTDHNIIGVFQHGDTVILTGEITDNWTQVSHNGETGWISSEFIDIINNIK